MCSAFPLVGLSGSRRPSALLAAGAAGFVSALAASPWAGVLAVGCAGGVDAIGRAAFPAGRVQVFRSAGQQPWQFAQRSAALVSALASGSGCLAAFPSGPCPAGLVPCASWRPAGGSGTWGTVCVALGLGVPVLLFAPEGVQAPAAVAGRFGAVEGGAGWWYAAPAVAQGALF